MWRKVPTVYRTRTPEIFLFHTDPIDDFRGEGSVLPILEFSSQFTIGLR